MRTIIVCGAWLLAAQLAAGCGGGMSGGAGLDVVASTNVYGDIAAQIGGGHVRVTSILTDPTADPHLFEPDTRTGLAVSHARLVVENGAGYDTFMRDLERAAPNGRRVVVSVADALGVHGHDANPHVWYDLPRLPRIAAAIAGGLRRADPVHDRAYRDGLARFTRSLRPLDREAARVAAADAGRPVAATEPLAGYLLAALRLRDLAPSSFARAIENGSEPSASAVSTLRSLIAARRVDLLLVNRQAVSPTTSSMRSAAAAAGVPVVTLTETLPTHMRFQQWQLAELRAIRRALAR
jgi:zinc/manganese transport system substrate-binding protein